MSQEMRTVLADTSSAILLFKTGLSEDLTRHYHVIMAEAVYDELTLSGYPGADAFTAAFLAQKIHLQQPEGAERSLSDAPSLGRGEHDTICLYLGGVGNFILIDDGKGAGYFRRKGIPYINALLFPRILHLAGKMSHADYEKKTEMILRIGRYSPKIADYAHSCPADTLEPFLPQESIL